jgi:hypothetical protein
MGLHCRETIARVRAEGAQLPVVSMSSKTSTARGASLHVDLTCPQAPQGTEANITRVTVDLPKQLPSRLTTLQKACTFAQFNANPANCPKDSKLLARLQRLGLLENSGEGQARGESNSWTLTQLGERVTGQLSLSNSVPTIKERQ